MISARSSGDSIKQTVSLSTGHDVVFDEPAEKGGTDSGPSPVSMIGAALAACTASTMRLYAARKEWDLTGLEVAVEAEFERFVPKRYTVAIDFPDRLSAEQVEKLRVIAGKCPVHRALAQPVAIELV